jgi:uncharacterized membrane protein YgcG
VSVTWTPGAAAGPLLVTTIAYVTCWPTVTVRWFAVLLTARSKVGGAGGGSGGSGGDGGAGGGGTVTVAEALLSARFGSS